MTTLDINNTPAGGAVLDAIAANTHTFDTPIVRGEQTITHVTLAKPSAGALRGTSLAALVNLDVDALRKVLPRISTPTLTEMDVTLMDPADLVALGGIFAGFFDAEGAESEHGIPERVEDAMADVATVFGWTPRDMDDLSLSELMDWRERARIRSGHE
ncbi:tape measure chaperone protein [Burkholderia phage Menos]|uniref:Tape measure chaperone protein n=1 Tax=Burkholderia phage Menos TaxID=2924900 RepID=A0AAE9GC56_9CAUD|nr:tape measure chaperone protein [Burkholderia phage Menos]